MEVKIDYIIFYAKAIEKKIRIPSFICKTIPVLDIEKLRHYKENKNGVITYQYNLDTSIESIKMYCNIKSTMITKSNIPDISILTPIEFVYLLNLIAWLDDIELYEEQSLLQQFFSIYDITEYLTLLEPLPFSKYVEYYIYNIFYLNKEEEIRKDFKNESNELKSYATHEISQLYNWGGNPRDKVLEKMIGLNLYTLDDLIKDLNVEFGNLITEEEKELLKSIKGDIEIYMKEKIDRFKSEEYNSIGRIEWISLPYDKKYYYTLMLLDKRENSHFGISVNSLLKSNFHQDWYNFFTVLPYFAEILYNTPFYKEQLLKVINVPFKRLNRMKNANYEEALKYIIDTTPQPIIVDEIEKKLRANVRSERNGQYRSRYIGEKSVGVVYAENELNKYLKEKELKKNKEKTKENIKKEQQSFNTRKLDYRIEVLKSFDSDRYI